MKKIKVLLLSALLTLSTGSIFAHALWIETASTGRKGQQQTVKVFYGEYADNERDSVSKWYSDVKDLTLWIVSPGQEPSKLTLKLGVNHYEATFTPAIEGTYVLQVSHEAKELGGTTKYHFLANAKVNVGKATISANSTNVLNLSDTYQKPAKANQVFKLQALAQGVPAKGKSVTIFSPNGWSKAVTTDESGALQFTPLWPGRYVAEISDTDRTPGSHHGKDFKSTWKGSTFSFEVL